MPRMGDVRIAIAISILKADNKALLFPDGSLLQTIRIPILKSTAQLRARKGIDP